jgi:SAM-dependent methyltransferase
LVGLISAILRLQDSNHQQRVLEGQTFALLEQSQGRLQESLVVINRALRDLEDAFGNLTSYAASNASNRSVNQLNVSIGQINEAVNDLRVLVEEKLEKSELYKQARASFEITNQALDVLRSSIQSKTEREELRSEIEKLQADWIANTESALAPIYQSIAALSQGNTDHSVLELARTEIRATEDVLRADLLAHIDAGFQCLNRDLESLSQSKVDRDALDAVHVDIRAAQDATLKQSEDALQNALIGVDVRVHDLRRILLAQERRVGLLLEEARKRLPEPFSTDQLTNFAAEEDHQLDAMYASFEDQFRGTRADIKQRQSIYLPYIQDAGAGVAKAIVVDLGCGRGEWLELLREEGLTARGVDTNRVFLAACREMDLDVVENDAVSYLRSLKPNSVGAVTCFHLIEHLPLKELIAVFDESLRVLKPGGLVIFETPNPGNLLVGSCNFYFDPTHRKPLPAPLTQSLLEIRGFSKIEVLFLHPYESNDRLVQGEANVRRVVNQYFFGPQDYAVLARKV